MKYYTIEIDEIIMNYLKNHAEPFDDTPNSVLHRLLLGQGEVKPYLFGSEPIHTIHLPKSLSQTLEVITEIKRFGRTRQEATKIVAKKNNTAPQTIIDKYCRQLGKNAREFDALLNEPGLKELKMILDKKYPSHDRLVSDFFSDLSGFNIKSNTQPTRSMPEFKRKKRDTALEAALKSSLGNLLSSEFGNFATKGPSQLVFNDARVLCKYSSFHNEQSRWFWGVAKTYWQNWQENDYLALILQNKTDDAYSYILLNSDEATQLFSYCSDSGGEKKINMRIYVDGDKIMFQEWKKFDAERRTNPLPLNSIASNEVDQTVMAD